jgi:hypothetical protein
MQLAAGTIATLPGMMVHPLTALAEDDWSESLEQDAGSAGTSVLKVVKLKANEIGVQVADMSTKAEVVVEGAHVRIVSSENDKAVEGVTDEYGMITLDITELARCKAKEDRTKLSEYRFYGSIEVDPGDGFRRFATGLMRFTGGIAHIIPTRSRESQMYPLRACFDDWDVLYTSNDFIETVGNTDTHTFSIELRGLAIMDTDVSLHVNKERRPRKTVRVTPVDGAAELKFEGKFLEKGHADCLPIGCQVGIDVSQGGKTKTIALHFGVAEGVVDNSSTGEDDDLEPFDLSNFEMSLSIPIPNFLPIIGGGEIASAWIPSFPVNVSLNPFGSFQMTAQIGSNSDRGLPTSWGYKYDSDPATERWSRWPRDDASKQWEDFVDEAMEAARGVKSVYLREGVGSKMFGHGKFFPNVEATGGLQLVAAAMYDWGLGQFRGTLGAQIMINLAASVAEQFVFFGIPTIVSAGLEGTFAVFIGCGMVSTKERKGDLGDWARALFDFGNWKFDYTNTGLTVTLSVSPFFSLGLGLRGVASVSIMAKATFTMYLAFTHRADLDKSTHPLPQVIVSLGAVITLVFHFFLVTKTTKLVDFGYREFYNRWKKASAQGEAALVGQASDDLANLPVSDLVASFNIITNDMLESTLEADGDKDPALAAQADDKGWGDVREDDIVSAMADGTEMRYAVYRIADVEGRNRAMRVRAGLESEEDALAAQQEGRRPIRHTRSMRYTFTREAVSGLYAMAEGDDDLPLPEVKGLGREGGVRPKSDLMIAENIYGDPRTKVVNIPIDDERGSGYLTCAFRIGVVDIDGTMRTRVIMELLNVMGLPVNAFMPRQVIDFDITDDKGLPIEGFPTHDELYDYDFDVVWTSSKIPPELGGGEDDYWHYVHFVIVSGKREQGDGTTVYNIANDLLFTYLSVSINDLVRYHEGMAASFAQYSSPANKVMKDDGGEQYHSIFSVCCQRVPDQDSKYIYIGYLDRASSQMDGVLSDDSEDVDIMGGCLLVDIDNGELLIPELPKVEEKMKPVVEEATIYELRLLPKIGGHYGMVLRSFWTSYYFAVDLNEENGTFISLTYAGEADAQFLPWTREDCFITSWMTRSEEGDERRRETGELRKAWWTTDDDGNVTGIDSERIGPDEFGIRKFGINGNGGFIFWPQGKEGDETGVYGGDPMEPEFVSDEDEPCYQIMAMRVRNVDGELSFSDPFVVADVEHRMRDLVVVETQEKRSPLEVISTDLVEPKRTDSEGEPIYHAANLWYTAVPNLKCAVVLTNVPIRAGVFAGSTGSFRVTIKNYGNCYLSGCTVQMCLHKVTDSDNPDVVLSEKFSKVEGSTMELEFKEETLLDSNWNPLDENGNLTNVEPDFSLAPGKIAEYRVEVPIPFEWQSGDYTVSFWAYDPIMAEDGGLNAEADEEDVQYVDFSVDPIEGSNYVKRTSLDINKDETDMTIITVNDIPDGVNLNDAPVQSPEDVYSDAGEDGQNGGASGTNGANGVNGTNGVNGSNGANGTNGVNGTNGTNGASGATRATPTTADVASAALPAGLAALGAAALAYERRRARNESSQQDDE